MALTKRYKDYIKSKEWERKRMACFAYHGRRCYACKSVKPPIHVHHMDYSRLGKEDAKRDLIPLCKDCHTSVTRIYRSNRRRGLRRVTMEYVYAKRRILEKKKRTGRPAL